MGLLELLYYAGYRLKRSYDLRRQKALPSKVISIGNITAGGTGKTPAAIAIALEALKRGLRPCILTRGYKGRIKGPCLVSKGQGAVLSHEDAGDEPVLMAEKLKGIPIIKARDRYEAGKFAIKELNPETPFIFILDDGFQHWRLKKDKDILLINALDPFGGRKLLPVGLLREPLKEIKRADVIVITNTPFSSGETVPWDTVPLPAGITDLITELRGYNPSAPLFLASHRLSSGKGALPLEAMPPPPVYAFCGIGEPDSFRITLDSIGVRLKGFKAYPDHYRFKGQDIEVIEKEALRCNAQWIITTEKDIIRLKGIKLPDNLISLGIEFVVNEGFYGEIFGDSEGSKPLQ